MKHKVKKNTNFYIYLRNQKKSFDSSLGTNMRKAARPLGGMVSLKPRRWRGKRLHHHGGGDFLLLALFWIYS
jgi:hypothetical protein